MSREGRAQPIQPFATHGFLGNTPANGVLPGRTVVVENDDRRRKTPPLQPVIVNGLYATIVVAAFTAPPPVQVVDRQDRRTLPLPAILPTAALDSVTQAPSPAPPAPLVIPIDERKRFLTPQPPTILHGTDDPAPPAANVVEPDSRRRYRIPVDPVLLSAALLPAPPPVVLPSGPYVVPLDERRRFLTALPSTSTHGFVDPGPAPVGTTPPPALSLDRADQRVRYKPLTPLILSGVLIPFVPPPPPVVLGGTDWAAEIAAW